MAPRAGFEVRRKFLGSLVVHEPAIRDTPIDTPPPNVLRLRAGARNAAAILRMEESGLVTHTSEGAFPFTATSGSVGLSVSDGGRAEFDDVRVKIIKPGT